MLQHQNVSHNRQLNIVNVIFEPNISPYLNHSVIEQKKFFFNLQTSQNSRQMYEIYTYPLQAAPCKQVLLASSTILISKAGMEERSLLTQST